MSSEKPALIWKSASITPICTVNGKIMILLGRESNGYSEQGHNWDTFGGGREDADKTPKDTAIREFDEETMGVFGDMDWVRDHLLPVHAHLKSTDHYIYILRMPHDPAITETYNRILAKMRNCFRTKKIKKREGDREVAALYLPTCPTGLFEKTQLSWYPVDQILASPNMLREHSARCLPTMFRKIAKYLN